MRPSPAAPTSRASSANYSLNLDGSLYLGLVPGITVFMWQPMYHRIQAS